MLEAMMMAGALSASVIVAGSMGPARADSEFDIGVGPGGGYDPGPYYWPARRGISCGEGRRIVASAGFRRVSPIDCHGSEYTYRGIRRDGLYRITLRSGNGRIKDVDRIRRWGGWGGGYDDGDYDGGYDGGYDDDYDDEY